MNQLPFHPPIRCPLNEASLTYMIDLRDPESFSRSHIKGSVNIPWSPAFPQWASQVTPPKTPLFLISSTDDGAVQAAKKLWEIGLTLPKGYILFEEIQNEPTGSFELEKLPLISPKALAEKMQAGDEYIIDVRTLSEWNAEHIASAHHIELARFTQAIKEIPLQASISIICGSGFRASIAASILQKNDFPKVANVSGGMQAWVRAGL